LRYATRRADVPVMIGSWGTRTARMTGEVGDELKIGGSANPAMVGHLRPHVDAGSAAAGRPAGSVGICLGAVTVIDRDRATARALARKQVTPYVPVIAALDPTIEDRAWLDRVAQAEASGNRGAIADDMPDDLLDKFAFAGDPDDLIRHVERAAEGGASRVDLGTPHGVDEAEAIQLIGARVLPHFRA